MPLGEPSSQSSLPDDFLSPNAPFCLIGSWTLSRFARRPRRRAASRCGSGVTSKSNLLPSVDRRATRWATRAPVCLHPCALPIRRTSERVQDVACNAAVVAKLRGSMGDP